jgi:hypothetical protein
LAVRFIGTSRAFNTQTLSIKSGLKRLRLAQGLPEGKKIAQAALYLGEDDNPVLPNTNCRRFRCAELDLADLAWLGGQTVDQDTRN